MNDKYNVIWKEGDGEMPPKAKHVVDTVRGEMLLKSLNLPENMINEIRYCADKNNQTVLEYISGLVVAQFAVAS